MSWFDENKQSLYAVLKSVLTFSLLFGLLIVAVLRYDFSEFDMYSLSFILASAVVVLLSSHVYDSAMLEARIAKEAEKGAEKLVASSQQLFMQVYDNSPIAYVVVNELGTIASSNMAAARLFGHGMDKLVRQNLFGLIDSDGDLDHSMLRQKFEQGIAVTDADIKLRRGTEVVWTKVSIFRFSSTDGKRLSLVTFVDVTKQRDIDTAKSEFVSLASHQLRTPISGMRWSAELLMMDGAESLTTQQKKYIDRLLSSINRMSALVDDFLQVSRFDLGTRTLKVEGIILADLCDDILSEQTEAIINKRIKLIKEYDPDLPPIQADLGLLRMVITNLTTNAVKYSRQEGEVTVSFEKVNDNLEINVKDTGMGIPDSDQDRIFSKVFRATNATKEVPDGTGLGLYIAKKAVEKMQGRIGFVSNENEGTTFSVVLPFDEAV
jgi:PAS domain S-box-containing protein